MKNCSKCNKVVGDDRLFSVCAGETVANYYLCDECLDKFKKSGVVCEKVSGGSSRTVNVSYSTAHSSTLTETKKSSNAGDSLRDLSIALSILGIGVGVVCLTQNYIVAGITVIAVSTVCGVVGRIFGNIFSEIINLLKDIRNER